MAILRKVCIFRRNPATLEGVIEAALDNPLKSHYPPEKHFRRSSSRLKDVGPEEKQEKKKPKNKMQQEFDWDWGTSIKL